MKEDLLKEVQWLRTENAYQKMQTLVLEDERHQSKGASDPGTEARTRFDNPARNHSAVKATYYYHCKSKNPQISMLRPSQKQRLYYMITREDRVIAVSQIYKILIEIFHKNRT